MSEPTSITDLREVVPPTGTGTVRIDMEKILVAYYEQQAALAAAVLRAEAAEAERDRERMRLAACGVAALGYFNGCEDVYRSASLEDVLKIRAERDALRKYLLDLLAVVHGDGGHHTEVVGTRQSVVDAELAFHALRTVDDAMVERAYRVLYPEGIRMFVNGPAHKQVRAALDAALSASPALMVQPTTGETP